MSEKGIGKSRIKKGGKEGKEDKRKKVDKEDTNVEKLLEKITVDTVIDEMVEHKWLVAKSIVAHIIGIDNWEKLSEEDKGILIKRANDIKLKTPGLM